jgi:multiple sugar transport system permease protein
MKRLFASSNPLAMSPARMAITYVLLGIWTIIVLFPLYWLVITAFKLPIDVSSGPKYIPYQDFQPSLHAWNDMVFSSDFFLRPYINTVFVGLTSSLIVLVIGACASYALNRFEYQPKLGLVLLFIGCVAVTILGIAVGLPWQLALVIMISVYILLAQALGKRLKGGRFGNSDIAFWLVSQRMLPPVAVIIPIYVMFQQLGLLNKLTGLVIAYTAVNLPLVVWFLRDYFQTIPIELEESAFIDGATRYQVLLRIVLPLAMPGLVATFLIVLVFAWNEYLFAVFLSGADSQTMPMLIVGQNATRGPQWWNISVLVLLMITPLIILAIILERYIAKGILVGAVKG